MEISGATERWTEIRSIWAAKENQWLYALVGFVTGCLFVPFIISGTDLIASLFPEMLGILFTVVVIDQLNERRLRRIEEYRQKSDLVYRFGSSINFEAARAAEELRRHGWLIDGTLDGIVLSRARLHDLYLAKAKLANANLFKARLFNSNFSSADLTRSNLVSANLSGAKLYNTNLEGAYLLAANLKGANLIHANLKSADLADAQFDANSILPDGTNWTPDTDMRRFTDVNDLSFWRSTEVWSYAYHAG